VDEWLLGAFWRKWVKSTFLVGGVFLGVLAAALAQASGSLVLATTTSTQDSGLLEALLPPFEKQNGIKITVLAVGSGQALELGRRGDADVLMVHSPQQEAAFIREGHGLARRSFMYNDFLVVGPKEDPAGIRGLRSVVEAFRALARAEAQFVSRGDESGTHVKEREIWRKAGGGPKGAWYLEGGTGMAATLRLANEKGGYTLSDRATFLVWKKRLALESMVEGDAILRNLYSVIVVSPRRHHGVNHRMASRFADYLFSPSAGKIIGEFGKKKYGQPLFRLLPEEKRAPVRR